MDDFDEFFDLLGTDIEAQYNQCKNPNWILGTKSTCPFVVATNNNYEKSILTCFHCHRHFVICECGEGLVVAGGMICAKVSTVNCPRLDDDLEDEQ